MSDVNSSDGLEDEEKRMHPQFQKIRQMASMNGGVPYTPIPVPPPVYKQRPTMKPEEFAAVLSSKLELVKLQEENEQRIEQMLSEAYVNPPQSLAPPEGKILRDLIIRGCVDDESDEDILNQHVSRVFKTPSPPILPKSPPPGNSKWLLPPPKEGQYDGYRRRIPNSRASVNSLGRYTDSGVFTETSYSSQSRFSTVNNNNFPICQIYNPRNETNVSLVSGKYKMKSLMACAAYSRDKPVQPFAQDPLMPLPPPPHTPSQLYEVARLLNLEQPQDDADVARKSHNKNISRNGNVSGGSVLGPTSSQQSFEGGNYAGCCSKMPAEGKFGPANGYGGTFAICRFSDEDVPYGLKFPGNCVTLREFKDILPKKGNYRYFFMTLCEDINGPIREEMTDDSKILPLWKDKIIAQIKVIACDNDKE